MLQTLQAATASHKPKREHWIPKGSRRITDKQSDAVAYVYERLGVPYAAAFHGRAAKPDWHFRFRSEAERERRIKQHFAGRRATAEARAKHKVERTKPHSLEAGHILVCSWGYEQTNVDFYKVKRIIGPHTVELVMLDSIAHTDELGDRGKCVPGDREIGRS
jgi:hypothetical protein